MLPRPWRRQPPRILDLPGVCLPVPRHRHSRRLDEWQQLNVHWELQLPAGVVPAPSHPRYPAPVQSWRGMSQTARPRVSHREPASSPHWQAVSGQVVGLRHSCQPAPQPGLAQRVHTVNVHNARRGVSSLEHTAYGGQRRARDRQGRQRGLPLPWKGEETPPVPNNRHCARRQLLGASLSHRDVTRATGTPPPPAL